MTADVVRGHPRAAAVWGRVLAVLLGGYGFCWGFISLSATGLFALGMSFQDAEHLAEMLAMLVYLVIFLWAFAARSQVRLWLVLAGGGALMTAAASLLQSLLI